MRRRGLVLAGLAVALGAAVLAYRGPGRALVRGHLGDVAATMFVFALMSLAWRGTVAARAAAAMALATLVELGQAWWHARSTAGQLLLGSTFDPRDLLAYALGVTVAVGWELAGRRCRVATDPPRAPARFRKRA